MATLELDACVLPQGRPAPGLLGLAERGLLPDALLRLGIRQLCAARLRSESAAGPEAQESRRQIRYASLRAGPIALHTGAANAQHYELPPAFFELCLGQRLKYSCAYYATGQESLDAAEEAMLALYGERADLADGLNILELGCGWGFSDPVDGRALSECPYLGCFELCCSARLHRAALPHARIHQCAGNHL